MSRHTCSNRDKIVDLKSKKQKRESNMDKYNEVLDEIESDFNKTSAQKRFWDNTDENAECSDLTVARDLSISIMTIFEIDSIEMKEGFIY